MLVMVGGHARADSPAPLPRLQDGDLLFHTSRSGQSLAIQRATSSRWSHVGMIQVRNGAPCVLEAIATVQCTPLAAWVARGAGGQVLAMRLRDATSLLKPESLDRLRQASRRFEGIAYDTAFGWSDDRLYCSELVWKIYQIALGIRIGELQKLRDFNLSDPEVRSKLRERYGDDIPLDEPVISPRAILESPLLREITEPRR